MATATITIRVDESLKKAASDAFEGMGLSLANGISVYLTRVAATKEIPFRVEVPDVCCEAEVPPYFGLTGEAYHQHLLKAKNEILAGNIGKPRKLIED